jgi:hypothetical protein
LFKCNNVLVYAKATFFVKVWEQIITWFPVIPSRSHMPQNDMDDPDDMDENVIPVKI